MSWIVGSFAKTDQAPAYSTILPEKPMVELQTDRIWLAAGGISSTFSHGILPDGRTYLVLGYPLVCEGDKYRRPAGGEWDSILLDEARIRRLDGRYLIVITNGNSIYAYNDPLVMRSMYIYEDSHEIFFTSSLKILKQARKLEIDFEQMGVYWHSMFPFSRQKYTPAFHSYYQQVRVLGSGAKAVIDGSVSIENRLFVPDPRKKDVISLLESTALAPVHDGMRIAISMSGGFDIRSLLAVYLKAGVEIIPYHHGDDNNLDYQISQQITQHFGFKLRRIAFADTKWQDPWQQIVELMAASIISMNPMNAGYKRYCEIIAESADTMVSGCFGELLRFRLYATHIASIFKFQKPDFATLTSYLYNKPGRIFIPEVTETLHKGFVRDLMSSFESMPRQENMNNAKWLNLFFLRYTNFSKIMPQLSELDSIFLDFMPWLHSATLAQHWNYSTSYQVNESVHRGLVTRNCPELRKFPLVLSNVRAPYSYRQYLVKLKYWHANRNGSIGQNRTDAFLAGFKPQIHDLMHSDRVRTYAPYDLPLLQKYCTDYFKGHLQHRDVLLTWLAFELGR